MSSSGSKSGPLGSISCFGEYPVFPLFLLLHQKHSGNKENQNMEKKEFAKFSSQDYGNPQNTPELAMLFYLSNSSKLVFCLVFTL